MTISQGYLVYKKLMQIKEKEQVQKPQAKNIILLGSLGGSVG